MDLVRGKAEPEVVLRRDALPISESTTDGILAKPVARGEVLPAALVRRYAPTAGNFDWNGW